MPFVGIGVRVGGNSARTSYAKQLAKAYAARVIADGGVVESLGCFTAFATALGAFKPTLLLDFYQNAAVAYSLRKLSTTYTGDSIRVRRASDNTELNIGFVNNELDTASLTTFCSGTDGFVTTWYDQSGSSNDATEPTAASQPKIVDSSLGVVTYLGKSSLLFDGTNDKFSVTLSSFVSSEQYFIVGEGFEVSGRGAQTIRGGSFWRDNATRFRYLNGGSQYFTISTGSDNLLVLQLNVSDMDLYLNNNLASESGTIAPTYNQTIIVGGAPGVGTYHNSFISEFVLFDNTTDREGKQNNINDFYSIY